MHVDLTMWSPILQRWNMQLWGGGAAANYMKRHGYWEALAGVSEPKCVESVDVMLMLVLMFDVW